MARKSAKSRRKFRFQNEIVEKIEGIGPTYGSELAQVGIKTLDDLRVMNIISTSEKTEISATLLCQWKAMACLQLLDCVDHQIAEALVKKGKIMDMKMFREANPEYVVEVIEAARTPPDARNIIPDSYLTAPITLADVKSWQEAAIDTKIVVVCSPAAEIYEGEWAEISAILKTSKDNSLPSQYIHFYVDGIEYHVSETDGTGRAPLDFKVPDLLGEKSHHYPIKACFEGTNDEYQYNSSCGESSLDIYKKCFVTGTVHLKGSIDSGDVGITATKTGLFPYQSQMFTRSSSDGSFSLYPLPAGETIDFTYTKDGYGEVRQSCELKHTGISDPTILDAVTLERGIISTRIRCDRVQVYTGQKAMLTAGLEALVGGEWKGLFEKTVELYVAEKMISTVSTDSNGKATFEYTPPSSLCGEYSYEIRFKGYENYLGFSAKNVIGIYNRTKAAGTVTLEGSSNSSGVEIAADGGLPDGSLTIVKSASNGVYTFYPLPAKKDITFTYKKENYVKQKQIRSLEPRLDDGIPAKNILPSITLRHVTPKKKRRLAGVS